MAEVSTNGNQNEDVSTLIPLELFLFHFCLGILLGGFDNVKRIIKIIWALLKVGIWRWRCRWLRVGVLWGRWGGRGSRTQESGGRHPSGRARLARSIQYSSPESNDKSNSQSVFNSISSIRDRGDFHNVSATIWTTFQRVVVKIKIMLLFCVLLCILFPVTLQFLMTVFSFSDQWQDSPWRRKWGRGMQGRQKIPKETP